MSSTTPAGLPAATLPVLLELLPHGVVYYTPLFDAAGEVVDFQFAYLNAAAQQLLGLPAQPVASYLQQWPGSGGSGAFAFHRDAWRAGTPAQFDQFYPADGHKRTISVHATRLEQGLLVSLTQRSAQPGNAVDSARPAGPPHEQAAPTEAEGQLTTLRNALEQAPMAIALLEGPAHVVSFANAEMALVWGRPLAQIVGRAHFEALPDLKGQGFEAIFEDVYHTGQPYYLREQLVHINRIGTGELVSGYFNIAYQPQRDTRQRVTGIIASATEVTAQVLARQQVQQLNDELELRVTVRSAEVRAALHEAEHQREQLREQQGLLRQILGQVPAAVATLIGPEHRFQFVNEQYQALVGGRARLGASVAEQLPELAEQGFIALLDQVYTSGQPYSGQDIALILADSQTEAPIQRYFDFVYQPLFDGQHQSRGILAFVVDTTEKVLARRQADTLQAAALAAVQRRAQQRQELYQVFAQSPVAIVLLREPDHRIEYFNTAFEELFPPEEWMGGDMHGHQLIEVYPRLKLAGLLSLLDRVFATGEPQAVLDMPLANLQPGSPRYVTFSYQAYREQGRIVGVAAFIYDVTEQVVGRREADTLQAALLAGAQRNAAERQELLSLFERAPVAVALLREPDHRIEYFNTAFGELFPGQDLLGRPVVAAYPALASADVIDHLDRVYETGETYQSLEQLLRTTEPSEVPRYITFTFQAYREHERIAGVAVFIHEVSEQVRARQARQAQQELVETVFEQSPMAIWVAEGPEYVFSIVNPLMEQILGRTRQQLLGRPYLEVMTELVSQGLPELLGTVWESGETVVVKELPARLAYHRADELGYFSFVFQPLRDAQGQVTQIACVAIEVTDQVLARQQVQQLNEELAAINQAVQATNQQLHDTNTRLIRTNTDLDTFVYTASHDLKAPISNIEGLLLALRQQLPPQALQAELVPRLFDMMEDSVARFQLTIGHLTDISQLQLAEVPETTDLPALISGVRLDLAPLLETADVTLLVDVDGCQTVRVAPKTLRSVVYNLLSNAVKYRAFDRPALVQLRAHCVPGRLVLVVQDNGLGLTSAQQDKLFGMFRRLHTHVEGSGVGLFMVKRLVENAGGAITVESEAGVGSTFTVSLPA
ncbi:PAS domain-containing protein [Hymenobacter lapidiphilus]|uniref:PAS domain-containing protein n=1 Tax=Hymenobacter sp. CCM 8763 TaxID=2303334 RepID=UPI000E349D7D|nr:PAS domain-containing protein [Hymenobacter sp. CCM 8763]RFP63557.1 PAS domain-containing protein [Hymenobacter sp. CCM 8763]